MFTSHTFWAGDAGLYDAILIHPFVHSSWGVRCGCCVFTLQRPRLTRLERESLAALVLGDVNVIDPPPSSPGQAMSSLLTYLASSFQTLSLSQSPLHHHPRDLSVAGLELVVVAC